jgi:general secretion pathway protein G
MKCEMNMERQIKRQRRSAFTLVELLLVLAILALLAGIVLPKLTGQKEKANIAAAKTQLNAFATALDMFEVDNGHYPRGKTGLRDLVIKPRDAGADWHQYLDQIPKDPWQNDYIYECPGKHRPTSYDLSSMGPSGKAGGEDNIVNWTITR